MKTIGQKIKERRKQLNLTQSELGKLLDISQNTVNQYENKNWKNPSAKIVAKIASVLSVPTIYLLDDNCQILDNAEEEVLLVKFRNLKQEQKKLVINIIKLLAE